jgi:hypothetical protein
MPDMELTYLLRRNAERNSLFAPGNLAWSVPNLNGFGNPHMACTNTHPHPSRVCHPVGLAACCLMVVLTFVAVEQVANADGVASYRRPDGWHLAGERAQEAVLLWRNGRERMLLRVELEAASARPDASALAWILPIPAPADQIKVGVLGGWPTFEGEDVVAAAATRVRTILWWCASSQLWPLAFLSVAAPKAEAPWFPPPSSLQEGITIDVLEERSSAALGMRLARLGVALTPSALKGLEAYVDTRSSFVVYRVADLETARRSAKTLGALAIIVDFSAPTAGYFPLLASSTLPGGPIDIRLTVHGFVRATSSPASLVTTYYRGSLLDRTGSLLGAAGTTQAEERFTEFRMLAYPQSFRDDLRFAPDAPRVASWADTWLILSRVPGVAMFQGMIYLAMLGVLVSMLLRPIWPQGSRPSPRMTVILGFSHLASVLGAAGLALLLARRLGAPRRTAILVVAGSSVLISVVTLFFAALTKRMLN